MTDRAEKTVIEETATRRQYRAPELVEYGSLEHLTAAGDFPGGDTDGLW